MYKLFIILYLFIGSLNATSIVQERDEQTRFDYEQIIPLTASTIDQFIEQAAMSTPQTDQLIRQQIQLAESDSLVTEMLINRYFQVRDEDFSQGLVILSIIGELRSPDAIQFYVDILENNGESPDGLEGEYLSDRDILEMYQAKAIQSLAYLRNTDSDSLIKHYVCYHPAVAVRSAGIDAYLFNHGDTEKAKSELKEILDEDAWVYLDRIRRKQSATNESIEEDIAAFYTSHPDQIAPVHYVTRGTKITNFLSFRSFVFLSLLFILVFLILRKFLRNENVIKEFFMHRNS